MAFTFPDYRIPVERAQGGGVGGFSVNAPLEAFGGGLPAQQLQVAAAGLERASNALGNIADREATLLADNEVKDADTGLATEIRGALFDPKTGYFTARGKDAVDRAKPTLEAIEAARDKWRGTLKSPLAQREFDRVAKRRLEAIDDQVSRHVTVEQRQWTDQASTARQQTLVDDIPGAINDPKLLNQQISALQNEAIQASLDRGEPPVMAVQKGREARSLGVRAAVLAKMQTDPVGAKSIFDANVGYLTAQDRIAIEHQLDQRVAQQRGANVNILLNGIATGNVPYGMKVAGYEGGAQGSAAKNADSGAGGRFQFIDSTWLTNARKFLPDAQGKSDAEVLAMRTDDKAQQAVFRGFTKDNEATLAKAGIPISDTTRYLAHWFGAEGAVRLLSADPNAPIEDFLPAGRTPTGRTWAQANGIAGKSVGQVVQLAQARMGEGRGEAGKPNLQSMIGMALQATGPRLEDQAKAIEHTMTVWRQMQAAQDADQRRAEHDLRLQGEEAEKVLTDLGNRITAADVTKFRSVLPANKYEVWMQKARGEDAVDVPAMANDLRMRIDKEDLEKELYEARRSRHLSQQTFDSLLEMNRRYMKDDKPGSPFKSERQFVEKALDPGILTDPAAMAIGRVAQARAIRDFDDFVRANPGADLKALKETASDLVRRYATVQTSEMSIALPVPRFYPDATKSDMQRDPPNIVQEKLTRTARSIQAALDSGQMSPEEAAKETKVIESWFAIQKMRAAQQPAPARK